MTDALVMPAGRLDSAHDIMRNAHDDILIVFARPRIGSSIHCRGSSVLLSLALPSLLGVSPVDLSADHITGSFFF